MLRKNSLILTFALVLGAGCEASDDDVPLTPADEFTALELQMITRGLGADRKPLLLLCQRCENSQS